MLSNSTSKATSRRKKDNQTSYFPKQKSRRNSNASSASSASSPRSPPIFDEDAAKDAPSGVNTPITVPTVAPLVDSTNKYVVPAAQIAASNYTPTKKKPRRGKGSTSNAKMDDYSKEASEDEADPPQESKIKPLCYGVKGQSDGGEEHEQQLSDNKLKTSPSGAEANRDENEALYADSEQRLHEEQEDSDQSNSDAEASPQPNSSPSVDSEAEYISDRDSMSDAHTVHIPHFSFEKYTTKAYHKEANRRTLSTGIRDYLIRKHKEALGKVQEISEVPVGYIYLFKDTERAPGYVKIGRTDKDPSIRQGEIADKCGVKPTSIRDPHLNAFKHFKYLETIIMIALHNRRMTYTCTLCPTPPRTHTTHQEWFHISDEDALEEVQFWRSWILNEKPFRDDGSLTDFWRWRVSKAGDMLESMHWGEWTRPTFNDRMLFWIERQKKFRKAHLSGRGSRSWVMSMIVGHFAYVILQRWAFPLAQYAVLAWLLSEN